MIAAAVIVWWKMRQQEHARDVAADAPLDPNDEIDGLIREAESKLASSQMGKGATIGTLPVVLVMGEQGAAKTSTVLNSGLEPELLAGVVHHDNQVTPTRTANVWLAKGTVFAEAGAKLLGEQSRWIRLVKRLKPGSLKSMVGGNSQAPRAAVICVNAGDVHAAGIGAYSVIGGADGADTIGEISQALGISFPVYALFYALRPPSVLHGLRAWAVQRRSRSGSRLYASASQCSGRSVRRGRDSSSGISI